MPIDDDEEEEDDEDEDEEDGPMTSLAVEATTGCETVPDLPSLSTTAVGTDNVIVSPRAPHHIPAPAEAPPLTQPGANPPDAPIRLEPVILNLEPSIPETDATVSADIFQMYTLNDLNVYVVQLAGKLNMRIIPSTLMTALAKKSHLSC